MTEEENLQRIENVVAGEIRPGHLRCTVCGGDVTRDTAYAHRIEQRVNVHYRCQGDCSVSGHIQRITRSEGGVEHEFNNLQQLGDSHLTYAQKHERAAFQTGNELRGDGGVATEQPVEDSEPEQYNEYVSDRTEDLRPGDRVVISTYRDDHLNVVPADVIAASHRCIKLDVPADAPLDKWVFREEDSEYLLAIVGPDVQAVDVYRPTTTTEVGGRE
ncbi:MULTISPECIES: hypothetical protein [unclassified Haloarcula]|uniref:hypothetical protein n=1 Tax=unclassified Haloarcula TaxID=2624677 RepID=UPI000EF18FE9|nr:MULTISPECIES: hypothetical protein [unclassified Haloarcula]RLM37208.1 hypothetical protein DVK01_11455 [Haloarcula sp. Atlit-120R]RLM44402.1 hypothetical protein DVK00_08005 [Haloarcula sp. Atlit-47R]